MESEIFSTLIQESKMSDKKRLENYDRYLISLRSDEKGVYFWRAGEEPNLEKEIKDTEYKRKLLLEKMKLTNMQKLDKWYQKWWGQIVILVISDLIIAFIIYKFGLN